MIDKSPKRLSALICDDIRQEQGNKITLAGVYTDGILFPAGTPREHLILPQFAVHALFEPIKTKFNAKIQLISPSKSIIIETPTQEIDPGEHAHDKNANFAFKIGGLLFQELGEYSVVFWFDDKKSTFKFNVQLAKS